MGFRPLLRRSSVSDLSPLAGLTNLRELLLTDNSVSDLSPLAELNGLTFLQIVGNLVSDLSPLVANTGLGDGDVVDVQENPLSYASIHTHIPILLERGVTVNHDNRAHPALLKISGYNQQGASGVTLAQPFVVAVQDENGSALEGVSVTFTVTKGGGTLSATTAPTDANGQASTTLTLGSQPGPNTVEATADGLEPVTFTTTAIGQDQAPVETGEDDGEMDDEMVAFGFAGEIEDQAYTAGTAIPALQLPEATGGEGEITYSVSELPAGLSFDAATRTISGTPEAATDGAVEVTYTAQDSTGAAATLTFSITVNPPLSFGDFFDLFGAGGG